MFISYNDAAARYNGLDVDYRRLLRGRHCRRNCCGSCGYGCCVRLLLCWCRLDSVFRLGQAGKSLSFGQLPQATNFGLETSFRLQHTTGKI